MTRDEILARATDPRQYDSPDLDWPREGAESTPAMRFFRGYLMRELQGVGVTAIDIGCGTGHLGAMLQDLGFARVVGLEPSARNAAIARRAYPRLEVVEGTLEEAQFPFAFDLAVAVMSFEHQADLARAFRKTRSLLRPSGIFHLITGDKQFHLTPRFGLHLEVHELPDGAAVVATTYPHGTIHDVVRPPAQYEAAAQEAGFALLRRVELVVTPGLIEVDSRWAEIGDRPVAHLFEMRAPARGAAVP